MNQRNESIFMKNGPVKGQEGKAKRFSLVTIEMVPMLCYL